MLSAAKQAAFQTIQEEFKRHTFLTHFNPERQLYIDIDASKERGFGAMVYHLKNRDRARPIAIEPILFLSKCLSLAESRYWPTELEMAGVVWTVRKMHYMVQMVQTARLPTIIWTDHSAIPSIANQTKLSLSNVDKLNLRLIRASTYLSQFRLLIRHKAGRDHVIPDALSKLPAVSDKPAIKRDTAVETQVYNGTIVELSSTFRARLLEAYKKQEWAAIWSQLKEHAVQAAREAEKSAKATALTEKTLAKAVSRVAQKNGSAARTITAQTIEEHSLDNNSATTLIPANVQRTQKDQHGTKFEMHSKLIYHVDLVSEKRQLCISKSLMKEIFKLAHDDAFHMGYYRAFNTIVEGFYIRRLAHHLKQYITFCPQCRLNQTMRHAPYESMVCITSPFLPFHAICMDFILALPSSGPEGYNSILTVTDKFSKGKLLIPGREDMSAKEWATSLLDYLRLCNWGIPKATISNRDVKFQSELWKELFKLLKVDLLVSTTYHPQMDGLFKRTNQTVKIALRYLITLNPDTEWHSSLPALQSALMNSTTTTIGLTPNQILYGHPMRDGVGLLDLGKARHIAREDQQALFRQEASNAIVFANVKAKLQYNKTHASREFDIGSRVYLQLHRGYTLPDASNKKLSNQQIGPFEITEQVGQLAYRLKLPPTMQIHPVVSVAQLKPAEGDNPYHRRRPDHPGPVEMEETLRTNSTLSKDGARRNTQPVDKESYKVKRIVNKRIRKYGRGRPKTKYRVKWLGWGPEWNQGIGEEHCAGAPKLIREFKQRQSTSAPQ